MSDEIKRESIYSFEYQPIDVALALGALLSHLNLDLVVLTDKNWPEGHPDRIRYEIKSAIK